MSILRTKTRPTTKPLYITRETAADLQAVWLDDKISADTKLKISHAESIDPYVFTKYEIRDIEITDDGDYRYAHRVAFPPPPAKQAEAPRELTPEERAMARIKMDRVRRNLVASGVLRG